jgi:hypothetical protein
VKIIRVVDVVEDALHVDAVVDVVVVILRGFRLPLPDCCCPCSYQLFCIGVNAKELLRELHNLLRMWTTNRD